MTDPMFRAPPRPESASRHRPQAARGRHSKPDPTPPPPAARPAVRAPRPGSVAVKLTAAQAEAVRGTRLLLRQHERADLEELLANRLRAQPGPPVVAVIGEAKRGKSTLVNALLGRRDLVPTGTDVTTGVFVEVHCASQIERTRERRATTERRPPSGSPTAPAARSRLPSPPTGSRSAGAAAPEGADAGVAGVGVGPTGPAARRRARRHPRRGRPGRRARPARPAGLPPGGPAGLRDRRRASRCRAPELAFLAEARRAVERVVIALTKIDKFPAHQQIAAEIRALLRRHAPRFAADPVVPVSARAGACRPRRCERCAGRRARRVLRAARAGRRRSSARWPTATRSPCATCCAPPSTACTSWPPTSTARWPRPAGRPAPALDRRAGTRRADRAARAPAHLVALPRPGPAAGPQRAPWTGSAGRPTGCATPGGSGWTGRAPRYSRAVAEQATGRAARRPGRAGRRRRARPAGRGAGRRRAAARAGGRGGAAPGGRRSASWPTLGRDAPAGLRKLLDPSLLLVANSAGAAGAAAMVHAGWIGAAGRRTAGLGAGPASGIPALALISLYRQGHAAQRRLAEWAVEEINRVRAATIAALDDLLNVLKPEIVIAYRALLTARDRRPRQDRERGAGGRALRRHGTGSAGPRSWSCSWPRCGPSRRRSRIC